MKIKTLSRLIAFAISLALLFCLMAGCGSQPAEETAPEPVEEVASGPAEGSTVLENEAFERLTEEGTLTVGVTESVDSFDPTTSFYLTGLQLVYDRLLNIDPYTGEIVGMVAESWEYLDDCTLELHIHEGITFQNGNALTAEDVLFSLERFITNNSRWATYFSPINFDKCVILDDYTLQIVTDAPYGPLLSYLATRCSSIVDKEYVEAQADDAFWWDAPNGSGPYTVVENASGSHTVYERRDDYWGEQPEAKTITVRSYAESSTMFIDYENGVLDACFNVDTTNAANVMAGEVEQTQWAIVPEKSNYVLALPEYMDYFQDINVRKAIAHAIDYEAVAEIGCGVLYTPALSTLQAGVPYQVDIGSYAYDPELAQQLLSDAGYAAGDITLSMIVINSDDNLRMAEAIQGYLAMVGITVEIEAYDLITCITSYMAGETDIVINSVDNAIDPDQNYNTVKSNSTNLSVMLSDEELNTYLSEGCNSVDEEIRSEAYKSVQQWMYDNYWQIPICDKLACAVWRPYIEELPMTSAATPDLRYVKFS